MPAEAGAPALTVATVNVNGVRAAFRRGMAPWLETTNPDVLLLQEVRADTGTLQAHLGADWTIVHDPGPTAGRAGVAVATRCPMDAARVGLDGAHPDSGGRWVEADLTMPDGEPLTLVSTYVHAATAGTPSMDLKMDFFDHMTARMAQLRDTRTVLGGDLNVAHAQRDLKNWKGNRGKSGFLPQEQEVLTAWQTDGWVDTGRAVAGDVEGPYTWWSWRGRAFDNDTGWRIDYLWCTPALTDRVLDVTVDRAHSYEARFSDHAPVRLSLA